MLRHAPLKIIGDACIQGSVGALQNIDDPVQRPLPYLNRYFPDSLIVLRPPWAVAAVIATLRQKSASRTPSLESCALMAVIGGDGFRYGVGGGGV